MEMGKRLLITIGGLLLVLFIGTLGFILIEKWSILDSLYMTVITIATVGFGEIHPLSQGGRIFCILLIIGGAGILLSTISTMTAFFVEGELTDIIRRKKMERIIGKIENHYILCGLGRVGRPIAIEFSKTKKAFLAIEKKKERIEEAISLIPNLVFIHGDATHNVVLKSARIERAIGLITALPTDQENLFVVLTASGLNPHLRIISRADDPESEEKLRRAGANEVIFPHMIGGLRMASCMLRPTVVNFLDKMLRQDDIALRVEEMVIKKTSHFIGKALSSLREKRQELMIRVLAIKERDSNAYHYNPDENRIIKEGDVLIIFGDIDKIAIFEKFVG
ncbi:MAG: potassium channel protein [bacterium]